MEKVDNGDILIDVKDKIANILTKNEIAVNKISINKIRDTFENHIIPTELKKPISIANEVNLDSTKTILVKTNTKGVIKFANKYTTEICGYEAFELIGQSYNSLGHPDMPNLIFDKITERLQKGEHILSLVKNIAKDGSFYWALTNFNPELNEKGDVISYTIKRKAAPEKAVFAIEKIYKILKNIEDNRDSILAEKYFFGFLEDYKTTFDQFVMKISGFDNESILDYFKNKNLDSLPKKRKHVLNRFFKK